MFGNGMEGVKTYTIVGPVILSLGTNSSHPPSSSIPRVRTLITLIEPRFPAIEGLKADQKARHVDRKWTAIIPTDISARKGGERILPHESVMTIGCSRERRNNQ